MTLPEVRGRLAPSPTGHLHVGHAFAFLIAWWHARSQGGQIGLRLEDVDVERASRLHCDSAKRDLEWLGIDWDGPARLQSQGLAHQRERARDLERRGHAYACTCTRGDLKQLGAPQAGTHEVAYPGLCRGKYATLEQAELESSREAGLRFLVPEGPLHFEDENFGAQTYDVQQEVGDFLILRRSKMPAYQLAVVLDDAEDGVTEVVRGADLLPSTARQIWIQRALGLPTPRYFHVPLITDAEGRRFAKREAALGLGQLREIGVDPRALVAWVARAAGQIPRDGELPRLHAREVLPIFRANHVGTENLHFALEELNR